MKPEESPIPKGALPVVKAPEEIWTAIERQLDQPAPVSPMWRWAIAALFVAGALGLLWTTRQRAALEVVRVAGDIETSSRVAEGEWLETNGGSTARITVGSIGVVEVEPNSRVRVIVAKTQEHRLELGRGAIEATISAPPRLFFVNTAATTAIDLGCAYRMESDEAGNGLLRVKVGWVALVRENGTEVMVPAGASCRVRAKKGSGTPYFDDAPAALLEALNRFDADGSGLTEILAAVRVRDTLTLWHVLAQVRGADRERVFDRMAALSALPGGVARAQALALDPQTLKHWREELVWTW
ncbi:MAG: hypothetical protein ABI811_09350 [Acidobacteriota bacterium]